MSTTGSLHYQLCLEGAAWLRRRKFDWKKCQDKSCRQPSLCHACHAYKWVAVELNVVGTENCDVWGFNGEHTAVIEVKVSHADFLNDRKKFWRSERATEYQPGNYRWYLCPEGVISTDELPDGWGLLVWDGKKIRPVKAPTRRMVTNHGDLCILASLLRREAFPEKIYNYRGCNTTIHPKQ